MNRKLIVTLLRKDIQELDMITEGFMEMNEYPTSIIQLAKRKIEDIQVYIEQLSDLKSTELNVESTENVPENSKSIVEEIYETTDISATETVISEVIESTLDFNKIENTQDSGSTDLTIETIDNYSYTVLVNDKITSITQTRNELLSKIENTLSSSIANKKIDDIKQAINIGNRFRFQRELFRGNGEDMNKTLNYINQLATLDEVQSFLQSKYGWDPENETVEVFYQIVRRRFL